MFASQPGEGLVRPEAPALGRDCHPPAARSARTACPHGEAGQPASTVSPPPARFKAGGQRSRREETTDMSRDIGPGGTFAGGERFAGSFRQGRAHGRRGGCGACRMATHHTEAYHGGKNE